MIQHLYLLEFWVQIVLMQQKLQHKQVFYLLPPCIQLLLNV